MKKRTLKVRSGHYDYHLKDQLPYHSPRPVPFILLKGYWLERIKFGIGKTIDVELKGDQLILTAVG